MGGVIVYMVLIHFVPSLAACIMSRTCSSEGLPNRGTTAIHFVVKFELLLMFQTKCTTAIHSVDSCDLSSLPWQEPESHV